VLLDEAKQVRPPEAQWSARAGRLHHRYAPAIRPSVERSRAQPEQLASFVDIEEPIILGARDGTSTRDPNSHIVTSARRRRYMAALVVSHNDEGSSDVKRDLAKRPPP